MKKKTGFNPFILLSEVEPGDEIVTGGGTGEGSGNAFAMPYTDWCSGGFWYAYDIRPQDGQPEREEYRLWWLDNQWSAALYQQMNGEAWNDEWGHIPP